MKVSLGWLKELVEYNLTPQSLADKLSLTSIGVKELTDNYLELDLTYNRGDLLSLRGVAREIAAVTGSKLLFSPPNKKVYWGKDLPETTVIVDENNLCPLYCVARIEGLKVQPSDQVWVKKLFDSGIRSVNNVADVTNLIMVEYGQPMHAFDMEKVIDKTLIVRTAKKGEELVSLDNKKRKLSQDDLLIADCQKPLGLAGVMGGKDSEVSESTTDILLEAAIFDPISNRNSAKRHGLYSEASKRFQHGLTKTNLLQALQAAIKMYENLGGKLTALSLVGDLGDYPQKVHLSQSKLNELLGESIDPKLVVSSLESLSFKVEKSNKGELIVTPPYFRLDISIEEDLIEEVARIYGYDKIKGQPLADTTTQKLDQSFYNFIYDVKVACQKAGLTEVQTYSFYSSKVIVNCQLSIVNLVRIANPISSETEFMRDNLWPNLLEVVAKNIKNGFKDVAIYEVGKVYNPQKEGLPKENYRLSIALVNGTDNPVQELNQIFQNLRLHLKDGKLNAKKYFHPVRFSSILAEVHPRFLNKFGIEQRVAVLEINLTELL